MRKIFVNLCVLALLTWFAAPALAKTTFVGGSMSVAVPDGWDARYNEKINQIVITNPPNSYAVGVQIQDTAVPDPFDYALLLSRHFKGGAPKRAPGQNYYIFPAYLDGYPALITVAANDGKTVIFLESGDNMEAYARQKALILGSLRSSNPTEQAVFDSMRQ